jgi:CO/xanthine dehydrogenase Mo-binding subunit
MDGPAPAILNAVSFAAGKDFNAIPLMPEDICDSLLVKPVPEEAVVA